MKRIGIICLAVLASVAVHAQKVTNVVAKQAGNTVVFSAAQGDAVKDKPQTPTIKPSPAVSGSWKNWKMR